MFALFDLQLKKVLDLYHLLAPEHLLKALRHSALVELMAHINKPLAQDQLLDKYKKNINIKINIKNINSVLPRLLLFVWMIRKRGRVTHALQFLFLLTLPD